jgi:flagellar biosynthesis protein FlhF
MKIKKYIAKSMREALIQIKEDLGEEAIILKTRKLPKKVFALGAQEEVEVTAAIDEEATVQKNENFQPIKIANPGVYNRPRTSNIVDLSKADAPEVRNWTPSFLEPPQSRNEPTPKKFENSKESEISELKQNVNDLKTLVNTIIDNGKKSTPSVTVNGFSGGWAVLYEKLIDSEVKADIAHKLIKEICSTDIMLSDSQAEKKFVSAFAGFFPVAGPLKLRKGGPVIVSFVGPTGSGKTTTLAKLAAHCCINKQKKVSIITADTYRIAAIEQIKMFADIVKVNLQVIFSPDEIADALKACSGDEIVFVDTAGRSQRNTEHMGDLTKFIETLHPDEVHLVLSATTKDSDLTDIIQRYKSVHVNRLLFTKLDETVRIGNIFNVVNESKIPISYFTFGQSVPDDIEVAQTTRFVQQLWEGVGV